jgi:uncharacterized integral membrane protein (TIGR00698 family)
MDCELLPWAPKPSGDSAMTPWSHAQIGTVGERHAGPDIAAYLTGQTLAAQARAALGPVWPGVLLVGMIVAAAFGVRQTPGMGVMSPMIVAVVLGAGFRQAVGVPDHARAGVAFSARRLLRLGIVLLGLQLTVPQVTAVGAAGVAVLAACVVCTFAVTVLLGRLLGVEPRLAELIAGGTSICGASAIMATNTVTKAPEEDVAYALAAITLFGSLAMFVYPLLPGALGLSPQSYGLWAGASIHEVAQVVGAGFQAGQQAGETGTVAKLTRVAMLAPVVMALGLMAAHRCGREAGGDGKAPVPWFVLGFVAVVILNSIVPVPAEIRAAAGVATAVLLSMALAAVGLEADIARLRAKGARPLVLAGLATLFIAGLSLVLVKTLLT